MDFDISKLQGDWSKKPIDTDKSKVDNSNNGKINSAFDDDEYIVNSRIVAEDFNEILGADFKKNQKESSMADLGSINIKSRTAKDAEKDIIERYLAVSKNDFAQNPDWNAYAKALRDKILSPENTLTSRGYYTTLVNQIDTVAEAMSKFEYNSRDDVKALYKKVKKELDLDKRDKFKDFKLDVLKQMVEIAEAHQKGKEKELIESKYDELRKTMSRDEAVDFIQESDEFKGSYFHDYWGQDSDERFSGNHANRFHKGLIHQMEDGKVMSEARSDVNKAIEAQRRKSVDDPRSSREIEKDVKKALKEEGKLDKYAKKYLRGELSLTDRLAFERSNVKSLRKEIAIDERVEHRKTVAYTENDIKAKLKNNLVFNGLLSAGLITKREEQNEDFEDTYNISGLSDKIRERLGANLRAARQTNDLYPYDEVENVVKDIIAASGVNNVQSKDARNLIRLCGFEVVGKNWVRIAINALVRTIPNGIGSAVAVGLGMTAQVYDKIHPIEINVNNKIHAELDLNIEGGDANLKMYDLKKSLLDSGFTKDDFEIIATDNGFKLIIDKVDSKSHDGGTVRFTEVFSKRVSEIALKTMLVNFALNFVQEAFADNQGEIPITTTQFQYKTISEYNKHIDADKKLTNDQKSSLKQLAEAYLKLDEKGELVKDENGEPVWDAEGFKLCLDKIAGSESMLDKSEFYIGINKALAESNKELSEVLIKNLENNKNVTASDTPKIQTKTDAISTSKKQGEDKVLTVPHTWHHSQSWQAVIATYYPEAFEDFKHNLKPLVDAFRESQGISKKSGIPRDGQVVNLDVITVNGKSYSPNANNKDERLKEYTSSKWFGWSSKYFSGNWKFPTEGRAKPTAQERVQKGVETYTSTRKSDNVTASGVNEKATQDALLPEALDNVETKVTITNSDGTQYTRTIDPKKSDTE